MPFHGHPKRKCSFFPQHHGHRVNCRCNHNFVWQGKPSFPACGFVLVGFEKRERKNADAYTHTHTCLTALFPGLPGWASTRKAKPIWILLKQETVSGSDISLAICKSVPCSRQITTPATHHSVFLQAWCSFYRPTNSVKALKGKNADACRLEIPDNGCSSVELSYIKKNIVFQLSQMLYILNIQEQ